MSFLVSWLVLSVAVWVSSLLLPGFYVRGLGSAMVVAALLGFLQLGIGLFSLRGVGLAGAAGPAALIGAGVFGKAIVLQIVDAMTEQLTIDHFGWALAAAVSISAIGAGGAWLVRTYMYCAAGVGGLCP